MTVQGQNLKQLTKKKKKVKKWGERKVLALQKNRVFVAKIISCISEAM